MRGLKFPLLLGTLSNCNKCKPKRGGQWGFATTVQLLILLFFFLLRIFIQQEEEEEEKKGDIVPLIAVDKSASSCNVQPCRFVFKEAPSG